MLVENTKLDLEELKQELIEMGEDPSEYSEEYLYSLLDQGFML